MVESAFTPEASEKTGIFDLMPEEQPNVNYSVPELWYRSNLSVLAAQRSLGEDPAAYQDLLKQFEENMRMGTDKHLNSAIHRARNDELQSATTALLNDKNVQADQELLMGTMQVFQQAQRELQFEDEHAMEKAATQEMVQGVVADETQAAALDAIPEDERGPLDVLETLQAKVAIFQKELAKASQAVADQSWFWDVTDFLSTFVPHPTEAAVTSPLEVSELLNPGASLLAAQQLMFSSEISLSEFQALLPKMVERLKDASSFFGEENKTMVRDELARLGSITSKGAVTHNILRGAEVATLPFITVGKVLGRGAISAARGVGNRALATKTAASTVAEGQADQVVNAAGIEEAMTEMMPSAMRIGEDLLDNPNISGQVVRTLEQNDQIAKEILETVTPQSLGPEAIQKAIARAEDRLKQEFPDDLLIDFDITENPLTKTRTISAFMGRHDGKGGFATAAGARAAARRRGLTAFSTKETEGQHFIQVDRPITEIGLAEGFALEDIPFSTSARMLLSGADTLLPKQLRGATHLAVDARTRLTEQVMQMQKSMKGLRKNDRRRLHTALTESEAEAKWLTPSELRSFYQTKFNREITDREMQGYYTYKQVNDVEWYIRNSAEYAKRQRSGVESVEINAPDFDIPLQNAKVHDAIQAGMDQKYWTKLNGSGPMETFTPGQMNTPLLQKLRSEGYEMVQLERAFVKDGIPVEYILAKSDNLKRHELDLFQVNYRPGGHRMYEGQWFIKQGVVKKTADGRKLVMNPLTHHVFTSRKQAVEYTAQLEKARLAYQKGLTGEISEEAATREIQEAGIGVSGFDEFDEMAKAGKIEADSPFETLFDRETPASSRRGGGDAGTYFADNADLEGASGWYASTGRMYYSAKGSRLRDPQGDLSPVVDPFRTAQLAIDNATRLRAFGDYRTRAVQDWLATFGQHLDVPADAASDVQRFLTATVRTSDGAISAKAEGTRMTLKRMLSMPTKDTELMQDGMRRLATWVDSTSLPGAQKIGKITGNNQDRNPVQALKSMAFDLYLGLGDISQLLIQPMTLFASMSVNPRLGIPSLAAMPWMRMVLRNPSDNFLKHVSNIQGKTGTGLDAKQFQAMVRDLRLSGKGEVSGELAMLDQFSNTQVGWWGARGVKKGRDLGRLPFFEAERVNRLTAYSMAWREWHQLNPEHGLGKLSQEGVEFVAKRTNDYSISMTSASSAWWQRGVLSVPTQFLSYQARLIEAMLPKAVGGSDAFTGRQKFQLLAGQILLFGASGVPAGPWLLKQYQDATGQELTPDQFRAMTSGLLDSIIYGVTGGEVNSNWASRAGIGELGGGMVADMFNGDRSFAEIVGGPAYAAMSDTLDAMQKLASIARAEAVSEGEMTAEGLNILAKQARSWDRYTRAWYIWQHGQYLSRKGTIIGGVRATKMEAIATALGVPLRNVTDIYTMQDAVKDKKKRISHMATMMADLRNRALIEPENADQLTETIRGLFAQLEPEDRAAVIDQVNKRMPNDRYFDAFQRYLKVFQDRSASTRSQANAIRDQIRTRDEGEQ